MTQVNWSQDIFSRGELSPLLYSRVTVSAYYNGLKIAKNVITMPQGAATKRFGTLYLNEVIYSGSAEEIGFYSFQYLNECTYLLVMAGGFIYIYLEGVLIATVTATLLTAVTIPEIDTTTISNAFRVTSPQFAPQDLKRTAAAANIIASVSTVNNTITLTTPSTAGYILPVRFTTTGTLPTTSPKIIEGKTYFIKMSTTVIAQIYKSAEDAKAGVNFFTISAAGTGVNNVIILNTWTFAPVVFKNLPYYDFDNGYDTSAFTPAAISGFGIVITRTSGTFNFTSAYVGGFFTGNGGSARITATNGTNTATVSIITNFASTAAIPGAFAFIAEPAWSIARGFPQKCSTFQSRSVFANTESLPNGIWLSVTNEYNNFDTLPNNTGGFDADGSISWLPSSDNINYIKFIVPYRSLTIHSNTGIFSTPLNNETGLTPTNFSMSLQDSSPATAVEPRAIDNQIVVISGNDVHSLLWDGFNASYTSTIASVANEHLIRYPIDECEYLDLQRAGSRYVFIINRDGTMTIFQTLISENVQGFTPCVLEQSYGNAYFRWAASSTDGRCWFLTQRGIAVAGTTQPITGFTANSIQASSTEFSSVPRPGLFTTAGMLPTSSPQVETGVYYWGTSADLTNIKIYATQEDALNNTNAFVFSSAGTSSSITAWVLQDKYFIEELSFDMKVDCAITHTGSAVSSVTAPQLNAQDVLINGDGYGFEAVGVANTVNLEAHGSAVTASEIQAGFPITVQIQTLPAAPPGQLGPKGTSFIYASHVRNAVCTFVDTIGGYVNGQPITMSTMSQVMPGNPPTPTTGSMAVSIMKGWSDYLYPAIDIIHTEPFDIKLTGLFYKIEV